MDTRYVGVDELKVMMDASSGLLWSPWFRIIAEKFLFPHWWKDLGATINSDVFVDLQTIHRFDPTVEHMGGAGDAGEWLGKASFVLLPASSTIDAPKGVVGDQSLKQGSYGKVKIHKHSKLEQLYHFDEIFAALWFKYGATMPNKVNLSDENIRFCDDMLGKVSRSFAAVIRQLPKGLCIDILVFYLALRALDTIEDDMEAFKGREDVKIDYLNNFYRTALITDGWSMHDVGAGDERVLLEEFHRCVTVFKSLTPASQEVIADITKRMGQGMASYVSKDLGQGTVTVQDYDLYCHYVAGLVGEGLSKLFHCTGYESKEVSAVSSTLANTMGLFLQKTNIIRDYLEDYVDGRAFWPQEIWLDYTTTKELGELSKPEAIGNAVQCLNHLVTNALECVPECIQYMKLLKTEETFRFCAIPQVMAIATLSELYNNPKVFSGVVKIRKGMAAQLILDTKTTGGLHKWFNILSHNILARVPPLDPNADKTIKICKHIIELTDSEATIAIAGSYAQGFSVASSVILVASIFKLFSSNCLSDGKFSFALSSIGKSKRPVDIISTAGLFCSIMFIFGYSIVSSGRSNLKRADP
jgi:farnesyl-diphosphate farnesyltransferase